MISALWAMVVAAKLLAATQTDSAEKVQLRHPDTLSDGMLIPLTITVDGQNTPCKNPHVRWLDHTYKAFATTAPGTYVALIAAPLGYSKRGAAQWGCGSRVTAFSLDIVEGQYPTSELSVDPKFSSKAPARVQKESAAIKAAWTRTGPKRLWTETFLRPTVGEETSPFGVRRTFNGKIDSRHRGVDYDGKVGDDIVASNTGVVALAADDFYYTGNAVFINHGAELFTMYFHMSKMLVKTGDKVERGQKIGEIGSTGRVTGPHLHFAVKLASTYVNPKDLLALSAEPLQP